MSVHAKSTKSILTDRPALTPAQLAFRKKRNEKNALNELALELFNHYNHRNQDTLTKLIKLNLDKVRRRIVQASSVSADYGVVKVIKETPIFKTHALLAIPAIRLQPNLDDIQAHLNRAVQAIINVSKSVGQWTKNQALILKRNNSVFMARRGDEELEANLAANKNYLKAVLENKDVSKLSALIATSITAIKNEVTAGTDTFIKYKFIWEKDRDSDLKAFLAAEPQVSEFEAKLKEFNTLSTEVNSYPEYIAVGAIALVTETLKEGIVSEIKLWKVDFGQACNQRYRVEIEEIFHFIDDCYKKLQRSVSDLDDIREAMAALKQFRDNEIRIDMAIQPIEECYAMLQKHEIDVPREEIEKCDSVRYSWEKLKQLTIQKSHTLLEIQSKYKNELKKDVAVFVEVTNRFNEDYLRDGPGVAGINPREASDRLFMFQNQFEGLFRKYTTYTNGEELFGLPITEYDRLLEIK